jgi:hypothetical protein
MDAAYDHIQEETFPEDVEGKVHNEAAGEEASLNTEFQEAYKAISNSPWGARLGGLWGTVRKQVCCYESLCHDRRTYPRRARTSTAKRPRSIQLPAAPRPKASTTS